jgi:hypothetical protein
METEWTHQMMETLGIGNSSLPIIWDADFSMDTHRRRRGHLYPARNQRELRVSYPRLTPAAIACLALKRCSARVCETNSHS